MRPPWASRALLYPFPTALTRVHSPRLRGLKFNVPPKIVSFFAFNYQIEGSVFCRIDVHILAQSQTVITVLPLQLESEKKRKLNNTPVYTIHRFVLLFLHNKLTITVIA